MGLKLEYYTTSMSCTCTYHLCRAPGCRPFARWGPGERLDGKALLDLTTCTFICMYQVHIPSTYFDIREDAAAPHRPQQEKVAVGNGPLQEGWVVRGVSFSDETMFPPSPRPPAPGKRKKKNDVCGDVVVSTFRILQSLQNTQLQSRQIIS